MITSKQAREGEPVTTYNRLGGIGIGYLIEERVYRPTGSYYAIEAEKDVFGMTRYERDGGEEYMKRFKKEKV